MLTVGEFALFLETSALRAKEHLNREATEFIGEVADHAKSLIGEELPRWPALADSTIREKKRLGFSGQVTETDPLLRSGHMRSSIEGSAEATATGVEGVVESDDRVAVFQEMGTVRIPPRPFLSTALSQSQPNAEDHFGKLAQNLLTPGVR